MFSAVTCPMPGMAVMGLSLHEELTKSSCFLLDVLIL